MVDQLRPGRILRDVEAAPLEQLPQLRLVLRPDALLVEGVDEGDPAPRCLQVDLVAAELDDRRAERLLRHTLDEPLDARHRVAVVGVRLVPLEHRELGVVLEGDALVAEVLAELVDALQTADDQALEVELGRDPEVEILVELVVVRHERLREGAAIARLQDGGLDFDEAVAVEGATHRSHHPCAQQEDPPRLLVHQQVEVALAIAELDVGEPVEGVGQRRPDPAQYLELVDHQRRLTPARLGRRADRGDDVAEVHVDLSGSVRRAEQLDPAAAVDEVEERQLPHVAAREYAAGQTALRLRLAAGLEVGRFGANGLDQVPVGKALRGHGTKANRDVGRAPRGVHDAASSVPRAPRA